MKQDFKGILGMTRLSGFFITFQDLFDEIINVQRNQRWSCNTTYTAGLLKLYISELDLATRNKKNKSSQKTTKLSEYMV